MVEAVIRQALSRFNDGTDTSRYDVFDYAELCCKLGNQEAQRVLGWSQPQVSKYTSIKDKLHPISWSVARNIPSNLNFGIGNGDCVGMSNIPIGINWSESHFRALLSHLPLNGHRDNAVMRGQLAVIRQALSRFSDGTDTSRYDVFDYAELCCKLGNQEAQRVLGWSESKVIKHSNIKTTLHPLAWGIARLTRNFNLSGVGDLAIVSQKLTIVTWSESHFRALLSYLPLNGHRDNAVMRGQLGVIRQALSRFSDDSNVTKAG